jgi:putative membrane protein
MSGFLFRWLITTLAIGGVAYVLPGFHVDGPWSAVIAALLLGLINAVLRPILLFLTLPITILTLGLFALVINGAMLALVAALVEGIRVSGFGSAVIGALLISVTATLLSWLLRPRFL